MLVGLCCVRTGVLSAQSRPASAVQSKDSTAQVLCSQVPCGASAEALHPGLENREILGTGAASLSWSSVTVRVL